MLVCFFINLFVHSLCGMYFLSFIIRQLLIYLVQFKVTTLASISVCNHSIFLTSLCVCVCMRAVRACMRGVCVLTIRVTVFVNKNGGSVLKSG